MNMTINENSKERFCNLCGEEVLCNDPQYNCKDHVGYDFTLCKECSLGIDTLPSAMKEIYNIILKTQSNFNAAQNIGITLLDKFENNKENMVPELTELAFYIQSLARGYQSQFSRANEAYSLLAKK